MPNFDPNNINLYPKKNLFNSFSQGVYEMGSTFKPITMAIGYDSNIIKSPVHLSLGQESIAVEVALASDKKKDI